MIGSALTQFMTRIPSREKVIRQKILDSESSQNSPTNSTSSIKSITFDISVELPHSALSLEPILNSFRDCDFNAKLPLPRLLSLALYLKTSRMARMHDA
jgi:hypothetical protein